MRHRADPMFHRCAFALGVMAVLLAAGAAGAGVGNVVGVFFDAQATTACREAGLEEPVIAYICLLEAAATVRIDGWELRVDVVGDADVSGWEPAASGLNVLPVPEFQVAIPAGHVLPAAPVIVLARFAVTPHSTAPISISLTPVGRPTLPGAMCFIRDNNVAEPLPMTTLSGLDAVPCAYINASVWPCACTDLPPAHEVLVKLLPGSVAFSSPAGGGLLDDVTFASSCLESLCVAHEVLQITRVTLAAPDSVLYSVRGTGEPRVSTQFRDLYRFVLADSTGTAACAAALAGCAAVRYAAATDLGAYASLPNDPLVNPYLRNDVQPPVTLDVLRAWTATGPEEGTCTVGVALLDEGTFGGHEELAGRVIGHDGSGVDGHATALAGIVAATANNLRGISGLTDCPVHDYRNGGLTDVNVARGLLAACAESAPDPIAVAVLGASFAGDRRDHLILQNACDEFYNANRLLVVAAGNHGTAEARYPAVYPSVIGVGGIGPCGGRWSAPDGGGGSALGPNLDFVALADSLWVPDGAEAPAPYRFVDAAGGGTSFAAAQVAGVAGMLLKQLGGTLYADDLINVLGLTAKADLPLTDAVCQAGGAAHCYGQGLVQTAAAMLLLNRNRLVHGAFTGAASAVTEIPRGLIAVGNVPWDQPAGGLHFVTEYRHERDIEFAVPYPEPPQVWGVGCATTGGLPGDRQAWDAFSSKLDCSVVSAGVTGCRLATSVYRFEAGGPGGEVHWWPGDGSTLTWGYAALGVPEGDPVAVDDRAGGAARLSLATSPTPFNARVRFAITSGRAGRAKLVVYDLRGRAVRAFDDLNLVPGVNQIEWDGTDDGGRGCATGAYLVRCQHGPDTAGAKVMLVK